MNAFNAVLMAGVVLNAGLVAVVCLRSKSRWIGSSFVALATAFIASSATYVGTTEGSIDTRWDRITLWSYVLAHALVPVFVACLVRVPRLLLQGTALVLLGSAPAVAAMAPEAWGARLGFQANVVGVYLGGCLVLAFGMAVFMWLKSPSLSGQAFWLIAGTFVLLDAGPLLAYELDIIGFRDPGPANIASPVALAAFALLALRLRPFPVSFHGRRNRAWMSTLTETGAVVFDERRPKYIEHVARTEAASGRPVLVIERNRGGDMADAGPPLRAGIAPDHRAVLRTGATVFDFLEREPRGLIVLPDLGSLATLSGWPATLDLIRRLARRTHRTRSAILISTSCLRAVEIADLKTIRPAWWSLPEPAGEIEAILSQLIGPPARNLLDAFLGEHGLDRGRFGLQHVEGLARYVEATFQRFSSAVASVREGDGMGAEATAIAHALRSFRKRNPADLARGRWPSKAVPEPAIGDLVTSKAYWKNREREGTAAWSDSRETLYERVRDVFIEHLGESGERLFRSELASLGRHPKAFGPWDIANLSDRAAVDLGLLADAIDLKDPRERLKDQIESLQRSLRSVSGVRS